MQQIGTLLSEQTTTAATTTIKKPGCNECRGELVFDPESGERICNLCGVVNENPENAFLPSSSSFPVYSAPTADSLPTETPNSAMMYDLNLPTVIDDRNLDANGKRIHGSYELNQLRRLNNYTISRDSERSNELKAMRDIDQIVAVLGLAKPVAAEACDIYRRGLKKGFIRGKSISSMAAAALLIACKLTGASCSPDQIEKIVPTVNWKTTRRYYKVLVRQMGLKVDNNDPSMDISRISGNAGLDGTVERRALEILAQVKDNPVLAGKRPGSLAAAALYIASVQLSKRTNQLRLAFAAGVTPITIRRRSVEISRILDISSDISKILYRQEGV